jgi:hypothetical protein
MALTAMTRFTAVMATRAVLSLASLVHSLLPASLAATATMSFTAARAMTLPLAATAMTR